MKVSKNLKYVIPAAIVVCLVLSMFLFRGNTGAFDFASTQLNGEAGILREDGSIIPLTTQKGPWPFSEWDINDKTAVDGDFLYWRFWLTLEASGVSGQLESVRFVVTQEIQGALSGWKAGTEGTYSDGSTNVPATSKSEAWFQVALPKDTPVTVPLKYRDDFCGDESSNDLFPYTTLGSNGKPIRDRRVEVTDPSHWSDGTTTWKIYCTVVEITWSWIENGVKKTGIIVPTPLEVSFEFTIKQTSAGLEATLNDDGSH